MRGVAQLLCTIFGLIGLVFSALWELVHWLEPRESMLVGKIGSLASVCLVSFLVGALWIWRDRRLESKSRGSSPRFPIFKKERRIDGRFNAFELKPGMVYRVTQALQILIIASIRLAKPGVMAAEITFRTMLACASTYLRLER